VAIVQAPDSLRVCDGSPALREIGEVFLEGVYAGDVFSID
jgi:hypothetical protein